MTTEKTPRATGHRAQAQSTARTARTTPPAPQSACETVPSTCSWSCWRHELFAPIVSRMAKKVLVSAAVQQDTRCNHFHVRSPSPGPGLQGWGRRDHRHVLKSGESYLQRAIAARAVLDTRVVLLLRDGLVITYERCRSVEFATSTWKRTRMCRSQSTLLFCAGVERFAARRGEKAHGTDESLGGTSSASLSPDTIHEHGAISQAPKGNY